MCIMDIHGSEAITACQSPLQRLFSDVTKVRVLSEPLQNVVKLRCSESFAIQYRIAERFALEPCFDPPSRSSDYISAS